MASNRTVSGMMVVGVLGAAFVGAMAPGAIEHFGKENARSLESGMHAPASDDSAAHNHPPDLHSPHRHHLDVRNPAQGHDHEHDLDHKHVHGDHGVDHGRAGQEHGHEAHDEEDGPNHNGKQVDEKERLHELSHDQQHPQAVSNAQAEEYGEKRKPDLVPPLEPAPR